MTPHNPPSFEASLRPLLREIAGNRKAARTAKTKQQALGYPYIYQRAKKRVVGAPCNDTLKTIQAAKTALISPQAARGNCELNRAVVEMQETNDRENDRAGA